MEGAVVRNFAPEQGIEERAVRVRAFSEQRAGEDIPGVLLETGSVGRNDLLYGTRRSPFVEGCLRAAVAPRPLAVAGEAPPAP